MAEDNIGLLVEALVDTKRYPRNLLSSLVPEHSLRIIEEQLKQRKKALFCTEAKAAVGVLECYNSEHGKALSSPADLMLIDLLKSFIRI